MKTENTTYEDMKEAFTEHTGVVLDADPSEDVPLEGVKIISSRTETGKLVESVKEEPVEPVKEELVEPTKEETAEPKKDDDAAPMTWDHKRPPSSWTPKAREDWGLIPEHLQKEIIRREENAATGASKLHTTYAPAKALMDNLHPYFDEVVSLGINPVDHVGMLLEAEKTLRTADMPTKFDTLLSMADQFGIPLRDMVNNTFGAEVLKPVQPAIPDEIRTELAEIRAWREQQELTVVNAEVEQFGAAAEFFTDVREAMADLIEKGVAPDLQAAYDMAVWSNPEIRDILVSRTNPQKEDKVAARQLQAAKGSVKSSGVLDVPVDDDTEDSIADTLRKAFNKSSGRV